MEYIFSDRVSNLKLLAHCEKKKKAEKDGCENAESKRNIINI